MSSLKQCRHSSTEPGRVGPEMPGRHAPALTFLKGSDFSKGSDLPKDIALLRVNERFLRFLEDTKWPVGSALQDNTNPSCPRLCSREHLRHTADLLTNPADG